MIHQQHTKGKQFNLVWATVLPNKLQNQELRELQKNKQTNKQQNLRELNISNYLNHLPGKKKKQ